MKKLLTFFVVLTLTFALFAGVNFASGENENFSISVKTDKAYYKSDEPVKITFTVKNNGNSPIKFTFDTAQLYDFSIVNYGWGKLVYRWSKGKMFAQVITHIEIPANGEKVFTFMWDQNSNTGQSVAVGSYMVNFWLNVSGKHIVPKPGSNDPYYAFTKFRVVSMANIPFPDVVNPYQQGDVKQLYNKGLIKGYPDGTFKPNKSLTRAEAVTLILRVMNIAPSSSYKQNFNDVSSSFWAFKFIEEAYNRKIVKGTGGGKFSPNNEISRGEFTSMLVRALKLPYTNKSNPFADITSSYFGYKEIITAYYHGIAIGSEKNGKHYFYPNNPLTRGDAAVEMVRAIQVAKAQNFSIIEGISEKPFTASENTIDYKATVPDYSINLNEVENINNYSFDAKQRDFLTSYGFFISKSNYDTFEKFYTDNGGKPLFITFDTFLQAYHTIFDLALRYDEVNYFANDLNELTKMLIISSEYELATAPNSIVPALKRNLEYLYVGEKLLNQDYSLPFYSDKNIIDEIEKKADAEIALINAHEGMKISPVFGYKEDYSQYVPRGHYTKTEQLKNYFKAMMWFGRMRFVLKPGVTKEAMETGRSQTQSAILLSLIIASSSSLETIYNKIYEPTVFFVGKSDDLNFYNYIPIIKKVYGQKVSISDLTDTKKIDEFIDAALKLPNPKISTTGETSVNKSKGFRLMGQRFTPDAYILQNLVYPKAGYRMMPKALDVFSVLGNKTAENILMNTYGEKKNNAYVSETQNLQTEFSQYTLKDWLQNLYWGWLSMLKEYARGKRNAGYPFFMQNENWAKKELVTALSSYSELKHDTILYAKQSYTTKSSMPILKPGYVEPNVEGYNRLITLLNMTENGLEERALLPKTIKEKIELLKSLTEKALEISKKELSNEKLSKDDEMYLTTFPDAVNNMFSFPEDFMNSLGGNNEKVPLVADIHTDPNGGDVLEEGVGNVNTIFVITHFNGKEYAFMGPVFSYYEFTEKMSNRLTDEKWQGILNSENSPKIPEWESTLIP